MTVAGGTAIGLEKDSNSEIPLIAPASNVCSHLNLLAKTSDCFVFDLFLLQQNLEHLLVSNRQTTTLPAPPIPCKNENLKSPGACRRTSHHKGLV
jgi:hypothetical protein